MRTVRSREAAFDARLGKTFCNLDMPDAPDMSGANAAAQSQAQIAREQWDDYKTMFAPLIQDQLRQQIDTGKKLTDASLEQQGYSLGLQKKYDQRYWNTQVPLEDSIINEANTYDTDAERERQAGQAGADVRTAFGQSRDAMMRDMASRGVDPSSGAAALGLSRMGSDEAANMAAAMNKTREAARQIGWGKKLDAASLAKGLPGFSSSASSAALGWNGAGAQGGSMGLSGAIGASGAGNAAASTAGGIYGSAAGNMRANAIESAKTPGFDALMGLAAGGMKAAGATYGGKGWTFGGG